MVKQILYFLCCLLLVQICGTAQALIYWTYTVPVCSAPLTVKNWGNGTYSCEHAGWTFFTAGGGGQTKTNLTALLGDSQLSDWYYGDQPSGQQVALAEGSEFIPVDGNSFEFSPLPSMVVFDGLFVDERLIQTLYGAGSCSSNLDSCTRAMSGATRVVLDCASQAPCGAQEPIQTLPDGSSWGMVWDESITNTMEWRPEPPGLLARRHGALDISDTIFRQPGETGIPAEAELYLVNADTVVSQSVTVSVYGPLGNLIAAQGTTTVAPNGSIAVVLGQWLGLPPTVAVAKITVAGQGLIAGMITGSEFACATGGCAGPPQVDSLRVEGLQ